MTDFYKNINPHLKFNRTIGENINADETIKLIIKTVNTYANSDYIKKVVEILDKGNPTKEQFIKRLFDTCCINVKYQRDPQGHEIIFTPKLLIEVGKGDCKKFTTFILSVLKRKNILAFAKVVSYDGIGWEHIYVIVPIDDKNYLTVDPVNKCQWNKEVDYKKAQLFYLNGKKSNIMNGNKLSLMGSLGNLKDGEFMNGISDSTGELLGDIDESFSGFRKHGKYSTTCKHCPTTLAGIGNDYINGVEDDEQLSGEDDESGIGKKSKAVRQQAKAVRKQKQAPKKTARKAKRKKVFKKLKKVGFAPARGAFLALIALGGALKKTKLKMNLGGKMAVLYQKNKAELMKLWETFGGKPASLEKAIVKASKTSLKGEDIQMNGIGTMQIEGIGVVTAAAVGASITAAAPILIAVSKLFKKHKIIDEEKVENTEDVVNNLLDSGQSEQTDTAEPLTKAGSELDAGGNTETQKEIIREAKTQEQSDGAYQDDNSNFKTAASAKSGMEAVESETANLPSTANQFNQTAKSFASNWTNPLSWLKAILILTALASTHKINSNLINVSSFILSSMFFFTIIKLTITKIKYHYGKI